MMISQIKRHLSNGTFISAILFRVFKNYSLSEKNVFKKQKKLLRIVLNEAVNHCGYYKKLNTNNSLESFPVVDKHIITDNFDEFISDRAKCFEYVDAYTGGSTGEPFHLLISGGYENDFGLRKWINYGYMKGDTILALDGTKIPDEKLKKNIYWTKKNKNDIPFGSYALSSLYLTDKNAKLYCDYIVSFSPSFIRGYPAFVYSISCYMDKYGISIDGLKAIELTSETPMDYQISKIKKVFHCPVYLQYGHTEACVFAYTYNEDYKYRVEPLYGLVEVLDQNNNHVKEGEIGEVVVTTLHNLVMPLIRYRTGDYAEYGGCDSRYIYLNKVLGRTQDYIYNKNGDPVLLTALIFGQHMNAMGNIIKWQIEQFKPGSILLRIIRDTGYSKTDEEELKYLFTNMGNVDVIFDYTNYIPLTPRGKSKMLIQHMKL